MNKKSVNYIPYIFLGLMIISILFSVVFGKIYMRGNNAISFWLYFISLFFSMEFILFHLSPPICAQAVWFISKKEDYYKHWWFKQSQFEKDLYKKLKVKHWKSNILSYDKNLFSLEKYSPEQISLFMTRSELVHEGLVLISYLPFFVMGHLYGHCIFLFVLCFLFSISNFPFIFVQRFNRPRLMNMQYKY